MIDHAEFEPVVAAIAREAGRRSLWNAADLKQDVWGEFYTPTFQANLFDMLARGGDATRYVRRMAYRVVGESISAEKRSSSYFADDAARYSAATVKSLLGSFFDWERDGALPSGNSQDGQPRSNVPENQRGDLLAMMCDVSRAVDRLDDEQREVLFAVEGLCPDVRHPDWDVVGEHFDITSNAARMRYDRVVERMTRVLNDNRGRDEQDYQGVGSRRAVSNSVARHRRG